MQEDIKYMLNMLNENKNLGYIQSLQKNVGKFSLEFLFFLVCLCFLNLKKISFGFFYIITYKE